MTQQAKPLLTLDKITSEPIHLQISQRLKQAIADGKLEHGERLPSTRVLASQLNVARGTVENAYALLMGEGLLITKGQAGTFINVSFNNSAKTKPARAKQTKFINNSKRAVTKQENTFLFQPGCPAYDAFPRKTWARLVSSQVRQQSYKELSHSDAMGYLPLRQALANYLRLSRGVNCEAEQIIITAGYQGALDLLIKSLSLAGHDVCMEDPGYLFASRLLRASGVNIIPVPVDNDGLDINKARLLTENPNLIIVTPSHQSPLGMSLSPERRVGLLEWAKQSGSWILEDDYDGEFRYSGYPLPALKSLDDAEQVIYAGSFSKTLFPALRLGYMVLPTPLVEIAEKYASLSYQSLPLLSQQVVTAFMAEGHFAMHLKKMRELYAERCELTANALTTILGDYLQVSTYKNGMHFVTDVHTQQNDKQIAEQFNARGFAIQALSNWTTEVIYNGLIIGFTNVSNKTVAEQTAVKLRQCFTR
ncbi:PLP-dependent aminotransferase family protein [Methylophaga sulfidovorans]|uniref:GntR family transcriptional regulator / MocR family aminotransferase n=1 Tax=Methylophaga sulfidovorans TaxID=45496 RepID=A0A1I4A7T5_9GAMM|nr:PLP-dependent aminotransferase family protein [Methylophaga sulfidovorans]SFK52393.1 GntR family transcriptional regulator / MocR family aminotransferase [Methylophaga sulfidovorans]